METCSVVAATDAFTCPAPAGAEPAAETARRAAAAEPLAEAEALERVEFWMGIMVAFSPVGGLNVTLFRNFRGSVTFLANLVETPLKRP